MALRLPRVPLAGVHSLLDRFSGETRIRRWAVLASVAWIVLVTAYALGFLAVAAGGQTRGTVFLDAMFFLIALILPIVLIWLAAYLAGELERQREVIAALAEFATPLISALDATRGALERHGPASPQEIQKAVHGALMAHRAPDVATPLERILSAQKDLRATLDSLLAGVTLPPPAPAPDPPAPKPRKAASAARARPPAVQPKAEALPLLPDAEALPGRTGRIWSAPSIFPATRTTTRAFAR